MRIFAPPAQKLSSCSPAAWANCASLARWLAFSWILEENKEAPATRLHSASKHSGEHLVFIGLMKHSCLSWPAGCSVRGGDPNGEELHAPFLRLRLLRSLFLAVQAAAVSPCSQSVRCWLDWGRVCIWPYPSGLGQLNAPTWLGQLAKQAAKQAAAAKAPFSLCLCRASS